MCRAGGRRCRGGTGKATQATRKQRSRATKALREAKASGDQDAIRTATERLDAANEAHKAAKENAMREHDNHDTADHSGDVATPKPGPVTGALSDKPLLDNTWGAPLDKSPVHYHDDGPVGTAVKYMGQDAQMDIDGEPLANVVGRLATNVVRRKTTAQQAVNDLKELRDRLPEGSRAHRCLSTAIRDMDGPDTPVPQVPPGTPEPLKELVGKLHAVPMVRQEPEREIQPLLKLCERAAAGDTRFLDAEVKRLGRKRHESLGDCGKFEIQDAVDEAVKAMREQERQQRITAAGGHTVHSVNIAEPGSHVGSQKDINTDDVTFNVRGPAHGRDVTPQPPTSHTEPRAPRPDDEHRWTVTNVAESGSFVGVQAGIVHGQVRVNGRRVSPGNPGQQGDVTASGVQGGASWDAAKVREQASQVQQEAAARKRDRARRKQETAHQDGDVTPTQSAFHTSNGGTVMNVVYGQNNGVQMGDVNGSIHFGPGGLRVDKPREDRS
ncbi:hypothetical protein SK571_03860 [Lentzea sp. BCCO 10_0798]|uniref:Uncharacterized protein n=1 Tax=Lentzea kristufekii TaxID=3095430 RepID=A0ABU4TJR9_9PSEU|nr:hypothetical protein [Lentzea sp. BCCO 10_0798]MDX8048506.1 hypothetical protein [Lentzea sp. BCCO 10_0798]